MEMNVGTFIKNLLGVIDDFKDNWSEKPGLVAIIWNIFKWLKLMIGHVQLKLKNSLTGTLTGTNNGTLKCAETHSDGGILHQVFAEIDHFCLEEHHSLRRCMQSPFPFQWCGDLGIIQSQEGKDQPAQNVQQ